MSADPEFRRRFMLEARAASALNHPNIITIYDIVEEGDAQYMVVEYVDGKTLREMIPNGGMSVSLVLRYATQAAQALCAAHAAGLIHRDLKPANMMVTGTGLLKLLDFGLAKRTDWQSQPGANSETITCLQPLTVQGVIMGSVNYMSPEQAEGKSVDARSDIFSFGSVLYEMLTGRQAFQGSSLISTLTAVLRDDVQPVTELAPKVSPQLEQVVLRCLKKNPDERYQRMEDVRAELDRMKLLSDSGRFEAPPPLPSIVPPAIPDVPAITSPGAVPAVSAKSSRRLSAAVILLLLVGTGIYFWRAGSAVPRVAPPPRPAVSAAAPSGRAPTRGGINSASIMEMALAKVDPKIIISQIRASNSNFNLSPDDVAELTKAGVPASIIEAMRDPRVQPAGIGEMVKKPATALLADGVPISLILAEDIPNDAGKGDPVKLTVANDVMVDSRVVIQKGAAAAGAIVDGAKRKTFVGIGGKLTFRLQTVAAVDGQRVAIRATPGAHRDGVSKRPVVQAGARDSKSVAAPAGSEYIGYVDGASTIVLKAKP
jgi:serine/threonine-protein kinase